MNPELEAQLERWLGRLNLQLVLAALAVATFLAAWNRGIALLYGMFVLLLAVLAVGYAAPYLNVRGVGCRRQTPVRVHEGDPVVLSLELGRRGRLPRFMLEIHDRLPFTDVSGERPLAFIPRLARTRRIDVTVTWHLRGRHRLGPLQLRSAYPIGIHSAVRGLPGSEAEVLVYPRAFPIHRLPLSGSSQLPITGSRNAARAGGRGDFFGVRDYRHGDSPRHVHWPASARRGELVVREFEVVDHTDVMIVLDLDRASLYGEGAETTLEYAVRIAASVARYALDNGHRTGLYGLGARTTEVPVARGPQQYRRILEALAEVQSDGERPYPDALREASGRMVQGGVMVLFEVPRLEAARPAERRTLFRHHLRPLWIRFDSESFEYPLRQPHRRGGDGYHVRRGDDLATVFGG